MAVVGFRLRQLITKTPLLQHPRISPQVRSGSYEASKFLEDVGEVSTKYEVTRNPDEWKFVERVLPTLLVPEPIKKPDYPSGWKPPGEDVKNKPYFVSRTKNHMMPVYLKVSQRGVRRHTVIRKIQGDIWQLEKDLRPFIRDLVTPKPVRLQVNEFTAMITIHGDHVNAIKYWLSERNF